MPFTILAWKPEEGIEVKEILTIPPATKNKAASASVISTMTPPRAVTKREVVPTRAKRTPPAPQNAPYLINDHELPGPKSLIKTTERARTTSEQMICKPS